MALGVLAVVVLALTYGRRITSELDEERRDFLRPLEGHNVTVVVGDYKGVWRTVTGQLSSDQRQKESSRSRWSVTLPNGRRRWFHLGVLREVRDPETGELIGGPW